MGVVLKLIMHILAGKDRTGRDRKNEHMDRQIFPGKYFLRYKHRGRVSRYLVGPFAAESSNIGCIDSQTGKNSDLEFFVLRQKILQGIKISFKNVQ